MYFLLICCVYLFPIDLLLRALCVHELTLLETSFFYDLLVKTHHFGGFRPGPSKDLPKIRQKGDFAMRVTLKTGYILWDSVFVVCIDYNSFFGIFDRIRHQNSMGYSIHILYDPVGGLEHWSFCHIYIGNNHPK